VADTDTEDLWDGDVKIHQVGYLTDLLGDRAVQTIGDYAKSGQPFLLSLHFNAPHWPWEGPGDEAESRRITSLADRDGGSMKTCAERVTRLDMQVGRVLKALADNRIVNNTTVVFTSDNAANASRIHGRSADTRPNCWRAVCAFPLSSSGPIASIPVPRRIRLPSAWTGCRPSSPQPAPPPNRHTLSTE
jgi:arylsulfatase A-like enzyme